jgi:hypothetical protein
MDLGQFSIGLSVSDLPISRGFFSKPGFEITVETASHSRLGYRTSAT